MSDVNVIADNKRYQPFSYVIKSGISQTNWDRSLRDTVHPAGMEVFGDLIIRSVVDFNVLYEVESTGYNFYIFDADDIVTTVETGPLFDFTKLLTDAPSVTEAHAIAFTPAGFTDSVLATDQGSVPYCEVGYWKRSVPSRYFLRIYSETPWPERPPNTGTALSLETSSRITQVGVWPAGALSRLTAMAAWCAYRVPNASPRSWYEKNPPKGGMFIDLAGGCKGKGYTHANRLSFSFRGFARWLLLLNTIIT